MLKYSKTISLFLLLLLTFGASAEEQNFGIYQPSPQIWEEFTRESSPEVKALILQMFSSVNYRSGRTATPVPTMWTDTSTNRPTSASEIYAKLNEPIVLPASFDESPGHKPYEEQIDENEYEFKMDSLQSLEQVYSDDSGTRTERVLSITIKNVTYVNR